MKKTVFKNPTFYNLLVSFLILLLLSNAYAIYSGSVIAVLPLVVLSVVLYLVINKHESARTAVKIWSILLILGPSLSIIGKLLMAVSGEQNLSELIGPIILLSIGISIFHFNNTTVEVEDVQRKSVE